MERRVFSGRDDEMKLGEVERTDVPATVGEVVGKEVVRTRVTHRRDVRIDENDDEDPHERREGDDHRQLDPEARPLGRQDASVLGADGAHGYCDAGNRRGLRAMANNTGVVGTIVSVAKKCESSRPEPIPVLSEPSTL